MMIKALIQMYFLMHCSFICVLDELSLLSIFKYISFHMLPFLFFVVNQIFIPPNNFWFGKFSRKRFQLKQNRSLHNLEKHSISLYTE
jgi:hypothetical protein